MSNDGLVNRVALDNWKNLEASIGRDPKDFIPIFGAYNYLKRAWPEMKRTKDDDFRVPYLGYFDAVALTQFSSFFVSAGWVGIKVFEQVYSMLNR